MRYSILNAFCILTIYLMNKLIWHVHFCISIDTVDSDTAFENSADHVQLALSEASSIHSFLKRIY